MEFLYAAETTAENPNRDQYIVKNRDVQDPAFLTIYPGLMLSSLVEQFDFGTAQNLINI